MAYLVDCITVNILLSSDSDFAIFGVDLGTFRIGII